MGTKLDKNQQHALHAEKAVGVLGCVRRNSASKSKGGDPSFLLHTAMVRCGHTGENPTKMMKGLEEKLRELGLSA